MMKNATRLRHPDSTVLYVRFRATISVRLVVGAADDLGASEGAFPIFSTLLTPARCRGREIALSAVGGP
jgi:hypothetical protein